MSILKRTFVSLYTKVDSLVGEIENHEALIKAAIGEQKQKLTTAKIEMRRMESQLFKVKKEVNDCEKNITLWKERAIKEAANNEEQALLCLQRKQAVSEKREKLFNIQQEYEQSLRQMQHNIGQCEADLQNMMQKHQMLKARQSTSEAMQCIDQYHSNKNHTLMDSFDRWEVKIAQTETDVDLLNDQDPIEQSYLDEEKEADLRYELAELLKDQTIAE